MSHPRLAFKRLATLVLLVLATGAASGCGGGGTTESATPPPPPPPAPPVCRLAGLTTSLGSPLVPSFAADAYDYDIGPVLDATVLVTPTAEDPAATITVQGAPVPSGTPSAPIDLDVGWTDVEIRVTAQDGVTTCTTTLHVERTTCANPTVLSYAEEFQAPLSWTTNDPSVTWANGDHLLIGDGAGYNDFAERDFCLDLTDVALEIECRMKLQSAGQNYRLPYQQIFFEDGSSIETTYLTAPYGWKLDGFDDVHTSAVPGEDHWVVLRITMTSTGGTLSVKPDDVARGWFSNDFTQVVTATWSHQTVTRVRFHQPWDSVCLVDWFRIARAN